jgi:hypothetical protein
LLVSALALLVQPNVEACEEEADALVASPAFGDSIKKPSLAMHTARPSKFSGHPCLGLPVLRQVQSLTFERAPFPVALQPFVRAHFGHPIRDDNASAEPFQSRPAGKPVGDDPWKSEWIAQYVQFVRKRFAFPRHTQREVQSLILLVSNDRPSSEKQVGI